MMDKKDLHQEAEEIREETATDAPELAEHDRVAELEKLLEEANGKVLYAHAETQNVRRRLEAEKQQASAYAVRVSPATCWRCAITSSVPSAMCPMGLLRMKR